MIDYYRKSILSQLGKDAGNTTMLEFRRKIVGIIESFLPRIEKERGREK